jgi:two-component system, LuxR family, response regulator FixJ
MTNGRDLVFVVDADLAVRQSLKFALEAEGLIVNACAGGDELLAHPELRSADCLVLDSKMPSITGGWILDRLAVLDVRVPIILMTSYATDGFRRRAAAAGVRQILEKPLLDGALLDGIRQILGQRGIRDIT